MTFTYSLTLSSNVHKIRNLIDDTNSDDYQLEDEEISSILAIFENDLLTTAAACLRRIATSKALLAKRVRAGDYEEDTKDIAKNLLEVAKLYEDKAKTVPYETTSQEILTDFNYRQIVENKSWRGEELD